MNKEMMEAVVQQIFYLNPYDTPFSLLKKKKKKSEWDKMAFAPNDGPWTHRFEWSDGK